MIQKTKANLVRLAQVSLVGLVGKLVNTLLSDKGL